MSIEGWAAAAVAVAGVAAAGAAVYGANKASGSAQNAQNIAQGQYQNTVNLENPYNQAGYNATDQLQYLLGTSKTDANGNPITSTSGDYGSLNKPFTIDDFHNNSPAYQFQLQQGQNGVLNRDSTNNGSLSGAALKDLNDYNQASANTAWGNAFNQYQTQQSNVYNRLANLANLGQSAASGTAQSGASLANTAANASIASGNAQANGIASAGGSLANAGLYAAYGAGGSGGGASWNGINDSVQQGSNTWNAGFTPDTSGLAVPGG